MIYCIFATNNMVLGSVLMRIQQNSNYNIVSVRDLPPTAHRDKRNTASQISIFSTLSLVFIGECITLLAW